MTMGEMPNVKSSRNVKHDYYVNDDGSVTKRRATKSGPQTSSFIVNEDGSVTNRSVQKRKANNSSSTRPINITTKGNDSVSWLVVPIGTVLYIIATIIFFILLVMNTYEEGETVGDWIEILLGLSFVAWLLYLFIARPILRWLSDLF